MHVLARTLHTRMPKFVVINRTLPTLPSPGRCLQRIHYQSCRPVYFYCLKTASIHYPKFFFFGLSCLSLFFRHALRSPTNELNAEETWKRLDKARLFEQRGDDIVPYDYTHLYQQKQENGQAGSAAASHSWVHNQ